MLQNATLMIGVNIDTRYESKKVLFLQLTYAESAKRRTYESSKRRRLVLKSENIMLLEYYLDGCVA